MCVPRSILTTVSLEECEDRSRCGADYSWHGAHTWWQAVWSRGELQGQQAVQRKWRHPEYTSKYQWVRHVCGEPPLCTRTLLSAGLRRSRGRQWLQTRWKMW